MKTPSIGPVADGDGWQRERFQALLELPATLKIRVLFGIPVPGIDGPITEKEKEFLRGNLTPEEQNRYFWTINHVYF